MLWLSTRYNIHVYRYMYMYLFSLPGCLAQELLKDGPQRSRSSTPRQGEGLPSNGGPRPRVEAWSNCWTRSAQKPVSAVLYCPPVCSSICLSIHLVLFSVYFGVTNFWLLLKILEIKLKKLCSVHPCIIYTWQFFCLSDSILFVKGRQNSIAAKLLKF